MLTFLTWYLQSVLCHNWVDYRDASASRSFQAYLHGMDPYARFKGEERAFGEGGWRLDRCSNSPPRKLAYVRFLRQLQLAKDQPVVRAGDVEHLRGFGFKVRRVEDVVDPQT